MNKKTRLFVCLCLGLLLAVSAQATVTNTDPAALAILPDNGCTDDTNGTGLGGISRPIAFTETGVISDVDVAVNITQTWRGDVQAGLSYSVGGGTIVLANNHGTSADNYIATFNTDAALPCSDATQCGGNPGTCAALPGGNCRPNGSLNAYDGQASPGTWTLTVCDRAAGDLGTLVSWAVTLDGTGQLPVELIGFSVEGR